MLWPNWAIGVVTLCAGSAGPATTSSATQSRIRVEPREGLLMMILSTAAGSENSRPLRGANLDGAQEAWPAADPPFLPGTAPVRHVAYMNRTLLGFAASVIVAAPLEAQNRPLSYDDCCRIERARHRSISGRSQRGSCARTLQARRFKSRVWVVTRPSIRRMSGSRSPERCVRCLRI